MKLTIEESLAKLENYIEKEGWKGYDPYDGLNTPLAKVLKNRYWRMFFTQSLKKFPVNIRPVLGIKKDYNPKAIGLFASGYLFNYKRMGDKRYLKRAEFLLDWLIENSAIGYRGYCWGYNFDWQSKVFFIPKGIPTVVNTSFIANALLDAYETLGEQKYFDIARSSCNFILNGLNRIPFSGVVNYQLPLTNYPNPFCFSYTPLDSKCVHNANLLAAELLSRVYSFTKENLLLDGAIRAIEFSLHHQNPDGSWYYGLDQGQHWIDSFHTGFVLVSLYNIMKYTNRTNDSELRRILIKGYEYYKKTFWGDDGLPHYYHNKIYPLDLHNSAQGIITFLKFKEYDDKAVNIANKIADWALKNMWDDKRGYFYFQKINYLTNHHLTIKIPYLRWPNAWMFYTLSLLLLQSN